VIIVGAGPAGLTAAYLLARRVCRLRCSRPTTWSAGSHERSSTRAIASTSVGTASSPNIAPVEALWEEILATSSSRATSVRIYYRGKFFDYPLKADKRAARPGRLEQLRGNSQLLRSRYRQPFPLKESGTSSSGCPTASAAGSTRSSSRRIRRRSGASRVRRSGGVGGAAHPEPVAGQGDPQRSLTEPAIRTNQVADRGISVSAARAGPDVGDVPRPGRGDGRRGADGAPGYRRSTRRRPGDGGARPDTPEGPRALEAEHFISTMPIRTWCARSTPRRPSRCTVAGEGSNYRDFLVVALIRAGETVPGQLDLRPLAGRQGGPHPELQQLER
jgi:hypothetical protein